MRVMTKHTRQLDLFRQQQPPLVLQPPQPCRCGCELAVIGEGKGPHIASLHCAECATHHGWVSHATHKFLTETINRFGRPTEPIVLRGGSAGADW
jgi:hypothetical protein